MSLNIAPDRYIIRLQRAGKAGIFGLALLLLGLSLFTTGCRENSGSMLAPYILLPQAIGPEGDRDILVRGFVAHKNNSPLFYDRKTYTTTASGEDSEVKYIGTSDSLLDDPITSWMVLVKQKTDDNLNSSYEYYTKAHVKIDEEDFYFNPVDFVSYQNGTSFDIIEDMAFSARVAPGSHKIRVYAPFFKPYEEIIETKGHDQIDFNIQLQPVEDFQPNYYRDIVKLYGQDTSSGTEYWQAPVHFMGGRMNYSDWSQNIPASDMVVKVYIEPTISSYNIIGNPPAPNDLEEEFYWNPIYKTWTDDIPSSRLVAEAREAFNVWQKSSGIVWFEIVNSAEEANITLNFTGWIAEYDESEELKFRDSILGYSYNPSSWRGRWQPSVTIALNKCSATLVEGVDIWDPNASGSDGGDGETTEGAYVETNVYYVGASGDSGSYLTQSERTHVLIHEIGHALGLSGHSPNASDMMYANLIGTPWFSGPTREPSQADINTLKMLYETVPYMHELGFVVPVDSQIMYPQD